MARFILDAAGTWEYTALGFRATQGDVLIAESAPDGRWSLAANQSTAETVTRHTLGSLDPFDGGVPAQHALYDHFDGGVVTATGYDLLDGGTP